jgi:hypothetical protein
MYGAGYATTDPNQANGNPPPQVPNIVLITDFALPMHLTVWSSPKHRVLGSPTKNYHKALEKLALERTKDITEYDLKRRPPANPLSKLSSIILY